ncbi:MAG: hypothetical protein PUP92_31950 [Rhizonema sp. PD38]|nr:hypothetical protein [Rhizonema sp. PD38]
MYDEDGQPVDHQILGSTLKLGASATNRCAALPLLFFEILAIANTAKRISPYFLRLTL